MTRYREIIRLHSLKFSGRNIIQQDEQKRRVTMYIPRKPGEQVEVD